MSDVQTQGPRMYGVHCTLNMYLSAGPLDVRSIDAPPSIPPPPIGPVGSAEDRPKIKPPGLSAKRAPQSPSLEFQALVAHLKQLAARVRGSAGPTCCQDSRPSVLLIQ
jgi:hypothetical protein